MAFALVGVISLASAVPGSADDTAGKENNAPAAAPEKNEVKKGESAVRPMVVSMDDILKEVAMPERNLMDVARLGEQLVYLIKWKGLPAGEATFSVKPWQTKVKGKPAYYLVLETESNDFVSKFYKVRDKIKSYVDVKTGHSLYFIRNIREGGYKADEYLQFDYENKEQRFSSIKLRGERRSRKTREPVVIPGAVQDPLSVLYYLRHFKLDSDNPRQVLVGSRKRTDILEVAVLREEQLDLTGIGKFNTYVVDLRAAGSNREGYTPKIFVAKGKINVWVEKNTNIPLMVQVEVPILGNADVVLNRVNNCDLKQYAVKVEEK